MIVHILVQYPDFTYPVLIKGRIREYSIFEALVPELQPCETSEDLLVDVEGLIVVALVIGFISFNFCVISNEDDSPDVSYFPQFGEHIVFQEEGLLQDPRQGIQIGAI